MAKYFGHEFVDCCACKQPPKISFSDGLITIACVTPECKMNLGKNAANIVSGGPIMRVDGQELGDRAYEEAAGAWLRYNERGGSQTAQRAQFMRIKSYKEQFEELEKELMG